MVDLRNRVASVKSGNKGVEDIVKKAEAHADGLLKQADVLKNLISDTKNFSDAAVRAATVYSTIVEAIYEALRAARMANATAYIAKDTVS